MLHVIYKSAGGAATATPMQATARFHQSACFRVIEGRPVMYKSLRTDAHRHTHTRTCIYIYICILTRVRGASARSDGKGEREREREREKESSRATAGEQISGTTARGSFFSRRLVLIFFFQTSDSPDEVRARARQFFLDSRQKRCARARVSPERKRRECGRP